MSSGLLTGPAPVTASTPRRVSFVQSWIPQYRIAFFERAAARLAEQGVRLDVLYGTPSPSMKERNDSRDLSWGHRLPTRRVPLGRDTFVELRRSPRSVVTSDLVIVDQAIRNPGTYAHLMRARLGGPRLALWGHGRTYTKPHSRPATMLKEWLTGRADWFFAYTPGGAAHIRDRGFPAERITIVQNSADMSGLTTARAALDQAQVEAFMAEHRLQPGRTALFIGGLDACKRLDLLIAAGRRIRELVPGFTLIVIGDGAQRWLVQSVAEEGWLTYLGPRFDGDKALAAAASSLMLMPGRVGLSIVDSFALQLPMFSVQWPYHAPEFEYLSSGDNGIVTADDVHAYADAVAAHLVDGQALSRLVAGCRRSAQTYTLSAMVDNFCAGVLAALA